MSNSAIKKQHFVVFLSAKFCNINIIYESFLGCCEKQHSNNATQQLRQKTHLISRVDHQLICGFSRLKKYFLYRSIAQVKVIWFLNNLAKNSKILIFIWKLTQLSQCGFFGENDRFLAIWTKNSCNFDLGYRTIEKTFF